MSGISDSSLPEPAASTIKADLAAFWSCALLAVAGMVVFTFFQYTTPSRYVSFRGEDMAGLLLYSEHLGIPHRDIALAQYIPAFRCLLIFLVAINIGAATAARKIDAGLLKVVRPIAAAMAVFVAVVYPPAESIDLFSYIALARLWVVYHLNPYTHSSYYLFVHHDPIVLYLQTVFGAVYGPIWTLILSAVGWLFRGSGLFGQVIVLKLIEAAALICTAEAAARYCGRRDPRYAAAAMTAIGLNPLCLIEGPGNGHNDIFMMALVLAALCRYDERKYNASSLMFGLATAIKFVPLSIAPFIAVDEAMKRTRIVPLRILTIAALFVLPTLIFGIPFWDHGSSLKVLVTRSQGGIGVPLDQAIKTKQTVAPADLRASPATALYAQKGMIFLYAVLIALLAARSWIKRLPRARQAIAYLAGCGPYPAWLFAWILFASFAELFIHGNWFSWYFQWPITASACIWTKRGSPMWVWTMIIALCDSMHYTM